MIRPQPPIQSLVYDVDGLPMTVVGVSADGTYTLMYETGTDRGFYRLMGEEELYLCLCKPYPAGTYDVVIEVSATKTVRVTSDKLVDLKRDMVPGTDTPPIPLGDFMINSIRPIHIVPVS